MISASRSLLAKPRLLRCSSFAHLLREEHPRELSDDRSNPRPTDNTHRHVLRILESRWADVRLFVPSPRP